MNGFPRRALLLIASLGLLPAAATAIEVDPVFEDSFESRTLTVLQLEPPQAFAAGGAHATVHVDNLLEAPAWVRLHGPGEQTLEPGFNFDPAVPGLLAIDIPTGLSAGAWSLEVQRADEMHSGTLANAFAVTDYLGIAFEVLTPVLPESGGLLSLSSEEAFQDLPLVMLKPSDGGAVATPLQGLRFVDPGLVEAPLPPGFTADEYDVLVINPDGSAGVSVAGLSISSAVPPRIASVTPDSAAGLDSYVAQIEGSGFEDASVVAQTCSDGSQYAPDVIFESETRLTVTLSAPLALPSLCLVHVQNSDGQSDTWSAVRFYSSSLNPPSLALGPSLITGRRAPALAMAGLSGGRQRVYVIGGDHGTADGVIDTIEYTETGLFGEVGPWRESRIALPAGRSYAWAAAVGQFLYLVGGDEGAGAVASVLRAHLLDPSDSPLAFRHTFHLRESGGLPAGLRSYRIAAVFPSDDPVNPGGEGLAGQMRHAYAPAIGGLAMELRWTPVAGASAYRVYLGDELLATTSDTTWIDDGTVTPDPAEPPLEAGETGNWHTTEGWELNAARSDFAGALSPLPGAPGSMVLYALGGLDDEGTLLDSYEFSVIGAAATASPSLGAWTAGADSLAMPVHGLAAWSIGGLSDESRWLFVGTGRNGDGAAVNTLERGQVGVTGDLGTFTAAARNPASTAGGSPFTMGPLTDSHLLILVGGRTGTVSTAGQNSVVTEGESGPDTGNWNTITNLELARRDAGQAQGGPVVIIAGGEDSEGAAHTSVEVMVR